MTADDEIIVASQEWNIHSDMLGGQSENDQNLLPPHRSSPRKHSYYRRDGNESGYDALLCQSPQ
jgi:hypothetical protein